MGPFIVFEEKGVKASPSDVGFPLPQFYVKNFPCIIFETLGVYVGSGLCMYGLRMHSRLKAAYTPLRFLQGFSFSKNILQLKSFNSQALD